MSSESVDHDTEDEVKSKGGADTFNKSVINDTPFAEPNLPLDIVTLHCPKDCLILYPVQPRKSCVFYI